MISMLNRYIAIGLVTTVTTVCFPLHPAKAEEDKPAVRLDGMVIKQGQVDALLTDSAVATQADRQAALEGVITQELMARQAAREGLDTDPVVVAALEAARKRILAQAFLERQARAIAKPTATMLQAYYDEHPALFRERAVFKLQEINIQAGPARLRAVLDHYRKIETLSDMVDWLKTNSIPHTANVALKPAEDLPAGLLEPVSQLKQGQVIKVGTDRGIAILQLIGKRAEPLTLSEAQPAIERVLMNQAVGAQVRKELSRLRKEASIEYYPPYASPDRIE